MITAAPWLTDYNQLCPSFCATNFSCFLSSVCDLLRFSFLYCFSPIVPLFILLSGQSTCFLSLFLIICQSVLLLSCSYMFSAFLEFSSCYFCLPSEYKCLFPSTALFFFSSLVLFFTGYITRFSVTNSPIFLVTASFHPPPAGGFNLLAELILYS